MYIYGWLAVNNRLIIAHRIHKKVEPNIIPHFIVLKSLVSELKGTITPDEHNVLYPAYKIVESKKPFFCGLKCVR